MDIWEAEDELALCADMPGVKPSEVNVHFENGELVLHGRYTHPAEKRQFLLQEYGVGDYYRAFNISEDIDAEKISAELKHGVLTVHLPKAEAAKPRRIAVKAE